MEKLLRRVPVHEGHSHWRMILRLICTWAQGVYHCSPGTDNDSAVAVSRATISGSLSLTAWCDEALVEICVTPVYLLRIFNRCQRSIWWAFCVSWGPTAAVRLRCWHRVYHRMVYEFHTIGAAYCNLLPASILLLNFEVRDSYPLCRIHGEKQVDLAGKFGSVWQMLQRWGEGGSARIRTSSRTWL